MNEHNLSSIILKHLQDDFMTCLPSFRNQMPSSIFTIRSPV